MRNWINLFENTRARGVISRHPINNTGELGELEDALCLWVEGWIEETVSGEEPVSRGAAARRCRETSKSPLHNPKYSMRMTDLMEANIAAWTVDPKLDHNEREMMSKFTGYDREMRHFSTKEKRAIRDPIYVKRVNTAFSKCPVPFSLYFWQSVNPDYDKTSFKGLADDAWLEKHLGETAAQSIKAQTSPDTITVVLTNNLSDENKVSLSSPWIVAHRIVHAMVGGEYDTDESLRIQNLMQTFLQRILTVGYNLEWPDVETSYGRIISNDYHEIYGKLMGTMLGTMKSARTGKITSVYEWWYETITQFIIKGKITFNPLPDHFDEGLDLTRDPKMRKAVLKTWGALPDRLERSIMKVLEEGCGKVFVV